MRELTENIPKPLLEAQGKNLLEHRLDILPEEIDEIVLVIGYKGEEVQKMFGDTYHGRPIRYVWQEKLDGTAGALHAAKNVLGEKFLVLLGDDLYDATPLQHAVQYDWAMTGVPMANDRKTAHLHTDNDDTLLSFSPTEKHEEILMDAGIHMIRQEFFDYEPQRVPGKEGKEWGIPQTLAVIAQEIPIKVNKVHDWTRVTSPEDLA